MPKGNSKAYLNSPMVDNSPIDANENAVLVQYALDIFHSPRPDLSKPEEVEKAINRYFDNCISKGLRPGNLGLYSSLGLDKNQVHDLLRGRIKLGANSKSIHLIKKACEAIRSFREILGSQGKLSPPVLIFWQKNFDGLEDIQKVELDANAAPQAEKTPEEVAQMIESDIPIDVDAKEV